MTKYMVSVILLNFVVAFIYAWFVKRYKQTDFLPRFLIIATMPLFGIVMMAMVDLLTKEKVNHLNDLIFEDELAALEVSASDISNINYLNTLPIYDALDIKDIKQKRERLFHSVSGDFRKVYPFLLRVLKDRDAEVAHYAAAAINDFRRKINENFEVMQELYLENCKDNAICKKYTDAFLQLIFWEELNEVDTTEKRKELSILLEQFFSNNKFVEEEYFIQKIQNEIMLKDFKGAYRTCRWFLRVYQESEEPYLALLKLFYCRRKSSMFVRTLQIMTRNEVVLSREATDIVDFWRNHAIV